MGRKEVARRFKFARRGDWGSLVEMWERDKAALLQQRERRSRRGLRVETEGEEATRRRGPGGGDQEDAGVGPAVKWPDLQGYDEGN